MMNKSFFKLPLDRKEKILFSIALAKGISGNPVNREEIIQVFKQENIELTDEIKLEIVKRFPEVSL